MSALRVMIVGGGLGGLGLAQGLRQAGIACTVFERDPDADARVQGYRLSLTPDGFDALRHNLPDERWRMVEAATAPLGDGMVLCTEQLDELMFIKVPAPESPVRRYGSVSRVTLRQILLDGLDDQVQFGKRFSRYEVLPDGVRCHFEDGSTSDGDLLVGCDGVNSKVQPQLVPSAGRVDTGVCAISGKIPLDAAVEADFRSIGDAAVIIDRAPQGMFMAKHQLVEGGYVYWSFGGTRARFPADLDEKSPDDLVALALRMMSGWSPRLIDLVRRADRSTVRVLRFRTSQRVKPWKPGRVTLLGDAIHSMPPSGGLGANTALIDASVLAARLGEVAAQQRDLVSAVADYEKQMFKYAFRAIDESVTNLHRMARPNVLVRRLSRFGAKLAGSVMGMRRAT